MFYSIFLKRLFSKSRPDQAVGLVAAALVLGFGIGGLVDGIVLHQILQWHHMLSDSGYPSTSLHNLEINTFADGIFHLASLVLVIVGLLMLWRHGGRHPNDWRDWPLGILIGGLLSGWGTFNLVEGIIDHHVLGIHHVREGSQGYQLAWDLSFLAFGATLAIVGWILIYRCQLTDRKRLKK